ncbi:MAG: hypothetical protein NVSMB63_18520 [Sediminibacterium sp.]
MKSTFLVTGIAFALFFVSCKQQMKGGEDGSIIGAGQVPNATKDDEGNLHIVFGSGDSIMYTVSADQGKDFSRPALVAVLPGLAASHMRGPQIASSANGIIIIAGNKAGDIFSYKRAASGKWSQAGRVNDTAMVAREEFMALGADGKNIFAVWLDLRDGHNKIFGAKLTDGDSTWSKNKLVYASPDTTVCQCCKPSVAVRGENIYVMFRNWLKGNRDLYLIQSVDQGNTFGEAKKLGNDSWALNGCPMDGGGLVINNQGEPETVWRRKNIIFASAPGKPEVAIGEGRNCTMESVNGKNVYAWTENGEVVVLKPQNIKQTLGKGSLPVIKSIDDGHALCIWENEKQIHSVIVVL